MIFGDVDLRTVPEYLQDFFGENHTATPFDYAMNHVLGVVLVVLALTSVTLNPVVFWYNFVQPRNIVTKLYLLQTLNDFLNTTYTPFRMAWTMFMKEYPDLMYPPEGMLIVVVSFFIILSAYLSVLLSAVIAACRFIGIWSPFYRIPERKVWVPLGLYVAFNVFLVYIVAIGAGFYKPRWMINRHCGLVFAAGPDSFFFNLSVLDQFFTLVYMFVGVTFITWAAGITLSLLSIYRLWGLKSPRCTSSELNRTKRSAVTIALINMASLADVVSQCLFTRYVFTNQYITFIKTNLAPAFISAYSPLVFVVVLWQRIVDTFRRSKVRVIKISPDQHV